MLLVLLLSALRNVVFILRYINIVLLLLFLLLLIGFFSSNWISTLADRFYLLMIPERRRSRPEESQEAEQAKNKVSELFGTSSVSKMLDKPPAGKQRQSQLDKILKKKENPGKYTKLFEVS